MRESEMCLTSLSSNCRGFFVLKVLDMRAMRWVALVWRTTTGSVSRAIVWWVAAVIWGITAVSTVIWGIATVSTVIWGIATIAAVIWRIATIAAMIRWVATLVRWVPALIGWIASLVRWVSALVWWVAPLVWRISPLVRWVPSLIRWVVSALILRILIGWRSSLLISVVINHNIYGWFLPLLSK